VERSDYEKTHQHAPALYNKDKTAHCTCDCLKTTKPHPHDNGLSTQHGTKASKQVEGGSWNLGLR
jgi:hypothetical protein